jgi:hypothetical protein
MKLLSGRLSELLIVAEIIGCRVATVAVSTQAGGPAFLLLVLKLVS